MTRPAVEEITTAEARAFFAQVKAAFPGRNGPMGGRR